MPGTKTPAQPRVIADALSGGLYSVDFTLGTANTVSVINIPPQATGFRITAASAALRYNLDAAPPAANVTGNGVGPVKFEALGTYNLVPASGTEKRFFDPARPPTTLQVNSGTGAATFSLEFF